MAGIFDSLDRRWEELRSILPGVFTTQAFRHIIEHEAPDIWSDAVGQWGPGGKGSGNYYSPSNVLANYLKNRAAKGEVANLGYVDSEPGWGSPVVLQWALVREEVRLPDVEDDLSFSEGKLVTRIHLARERHPALRRKLLAQRLPGGLRCDMCGYGADEFPIGLRDAPFDAHHSRAPLAQAGEGKTRLSDVALLCVRCHRLLHRLVATRARWFTPIEASVELGLRS